MQPDIKHTYSEVTVRIQFNFHFTLDLKSSDLVSTLSLKFYLYAPQFVPPTYLFDAITR